MDIVYVRDLEIKACIGVFEWERQLKQKLIVNLEMATDFSAAAHSDQIADAVDYQYAISHIQQLAEHSGFHLLESLASTIAEELLAHFAISGVRVDLAKPAIIPSCRQVGVVVKRGREF